MNMTDLFGNHNSNIVVYIVYLFTEIVLCCFTLNSLHDLAIMGWKPFQSSDFFSCMYLLLKYFLNLFAWHI